MKFLKGIAALLAILVGIAGIVLSAGAVVGTWSRVEHLERDVPRTIGHVASAVNAVRDHGMLAADVMQRSRNRLDTVQVAVKEISKSVDADDEKAILDTLDGDVTRQLGRAEGFVRSMQASLQSTSSALLVLDSIPFLGSRKLRPDAQDKSDLKNLASSMAEMSEALDQLSGTLAEIRTARSVDPQQAARMERALTRVAGELERIETEITAFTGRMDEIGRDLSHTKHAVSRHLHTAALAVTAFFVCFAFSQLSLFCQGVRLLRRRRPAQK